MPSITDPEGSACTVTVSYMGSATLPAFVTYTGNTFTFNPVTGHAGNYRIDLSVADEVNTYSSFFNIQVTSATTNLPPSLSSALTKQTVIKGIPFAYTLPTASDPES